MERHQFPQIFMGLMAASEPRAGAGGDHLPHTTLAWILNDSELWHG